MSGWRDRAVCVDAAPEVFFPSLNSGRIPVGYTPDHLWAEAVYYCKRCPVRAECLEDALVAGVQDGMFGGMTPEQRARVKSS